MTGPTFVQDGYDALRCGVIKNRHATYEHCRVVLTLQIFTPKHLELGP